MENKSLFVTWERILDIISKIPNFPTHMPKKPLANHDLIRFCKSKSDNLHKGYHPLYSKGVNQYDMEHVQEWIDMQIKSQAKASMETAEVEAVKAMINLPESEFMALAKSYNYHKLKTTIKHVFKLWDKETNAKDAISPTFDDTPAIRKLVKAGDLLREESYARKEFQEEQGNEWDDMLNLWNGRLKQ